MGPTKAMGTFLRVWRSEWAGLSRAQLAIAVSAQMANAKAVTSRAVRWWEEGNPPGSTEEFEGLCKVMRRNGLTHPEVEDFRKAVFAACLDRQYPELFPHADLAHRPDVNEVAHAIRAAAPTSTVRVVAALKEVEAVVRDRRPRDAGRPQGRRQDVALAELFRAHADCHKNAWGREHVFVRAQQALSELLADRFGGWLSGDLNCHGSEFTIMVGKTQLSESDSQFPAMLAYHRACEESGNTHWGAACFIVIVGLAYAYCDAELRQSLLARKSETFAVLRDGESCHVDMAHLQFARCALGAGLLADAEWHLGQIPHFADMETGDTDCSWHDVAGRLLLAQGRPGAGLGHFEQALAIARRRSTAGGIAALEALVEACEREITAARLRRGRSPNAKSPAKKTKRKPKPRKPKQ